MGKQETRPTVRPISDAAYNPVGDLGQNFRHDGKPLGGVSDWDTPLQTNPNYTPNIGLDEFYIGDRYTSTLPGTDYEDVHANQQSGMEQAFRGLTKGVNLTATTVLGGFGTVYGLGSAMVNGKLSNIWDNPIMNGLDEWNNKVDQDWLPNYYAAKETEAKWYETDNWFTANFLFDKVVKNSGFAVGAMISGNIANAGLMKAGTAIGKWASAASKAREAKEAFGAYTNLLRNTSRVFSQGKNIEAATILEKELTSMTELAVKNKQLLELAKSTGKFTNISNAGRKTAIAAYSSAGEANFEALQTSKEYREKLMEEYIQEHGTTPVGEALKEIDDRASTVGAISFGGNLALLGVTEWFQLPYLTGSSYKATKAAGSRFIRETGETAFDAAGKVIAKTHTTKFGKLFHGLKKDAKSLEMPGFTKYFLDPKEGMQEIGQYALQVGTQNYFDKQHSSGAADAWVDGVMFGLYGEKDGEGVGALNSKEGMEGGVLGMLTGGIMQGRQKYTDRKQIRTNTKDFLDELERTPSFRDAFKEKMADANRGVVLQEQHTKASAEGDIVEVKDLEHDMMFNYIFNKIKYGRKDLIQKDIEEMKQMANTPEDLATLKEQGFANKDDDQQSFGKKLDNILGFIDHLTRTAENVADVYGSQTVEDLEGNTRLKYNESVIKKLTYAASKIADYDVRLPQLETDLIGAGLDVSEILKNVSDYDKQLDAWYEQASKLETPEISSSLKKEQIPVLAKKLEDITEISRRKAQFLKEYDEIVANPQQFEDSGKPLKEGSADDVAPGKIKISTKNSPEGREYDKETEYFLGNSFELDKDGNPIYRFPKITIIGENEDGSVKIKDDRGVIRDISRAEFEDYNLGTADEFQKSPDAKFFFRNSKKQVFWNAGARRGGKIPGWLKWDNKNDNLIFSYRNGKGKIKEKVINIDMFKPQEKWFKEGLYTFGEERLSEEDLADIANAAKSGRTAQKMRDRRSDRLYMLTELHDEMSKKAEATDKLISDKKKLLTTLKEKVAKQKEELSKRPQHDSRFKKSLYFKKASKETLQSIMQLSRTIDDLEKEIENLEVQEIDILDAIEYIEYLADNIDDQADDATEFLAQLKGERKTLLEGRNQTWAQIKAIKSLMKSTKKTLAASYDLVANLVFTFQKTYPDVPSLGTQDFIAYLKEQRGKLLVENIEDPYVYRDARIALQDLNDEIQYIEEAEIPVNEKRLADLQEHLDIMEQDVLEIEAQYTAMSPIVDKMQEYVDTIEKAEKEMLAFMENSDMHDDIIGTHSTEEVAQPGNDNYEIDSKKSRWEVAGSTSVSSEFDEPHHLRAERFAFNWHKIAGRRTIKTVPIHAGTENDLLPGLIDFVHSFAEAQGKKFDKSKAIFAVFVKETKDGTLILVGEDGEALSTEQLKDPLNHAIYQPFPGEDLKVIARSGEDKGKLVSMFRKGTADADVKSISAKYKSWRDGVLKKDAPIPSARQMTPSYGTPVYVEKFVEGIDNKPGTWVRDYAARTSAADAQLIDEYGLEAEPLLQVATTNTAVTNNGVTIKTPLGRVFLNTPAGIVPMNSRKLNRNEAATIVKVLKQIAKKVNSTERLDEDTTELFTWLRSVVHWGKPVQKIDKNGVVVEKQAGYNAMWFDRVLDDKQEKMEPRLFISGLGFNLPFTPGFLKTHENAIIETLQEMYHTVDAKPVNGKNFDASYDQIIDINEDGTPVYNHWQNYQTYLLSNESRKDNEIPLTTNMAPIIEDEDVNRKGIYFTFSDAEDIFKPVAPKKKKTVKKATKKVADDTEEEVDDTPGTTVTQTDNPVLDNNTENIFVFGKDGAYAKYTATKDGVQKLVLFNWESTRKAIVKAKGPAEIANFIEQMKYKILENVIKPSLANGELKQTVLPLTDDFSRIAKASDDLDAAAEAMRENDDEELNRIALEEAYDTPENWTELEAFVKRALPNVPFYRVKNLINATKGRKALGMFHKAAVYVYEGAETGTGYHEVFEAVWKMLASPEEKAAVVKEFKARKGTFKDRETGNVIAYSDATAQQLKEELAEEFRAYKLNQNKKPKGIIGKIFEDLLNFLKELFNGKIINFFEKIDSGHFATYNAFEKQLSYAERGIVDIENATGDKTSEFRIDVPTRELNDVIQHMTYSTISRLFVDGQSIMRESSFKKADLYYDLKNEIIGKIGSERNIYKAVRINAKEKGNKKLEQQALAREQGYVQLGIQIEDQWESIVDRHLENLQTYNITFDDNDYSIIHDEDNSGKGDYIDARKVDPFKKSSSAVKLILATLPEISPKTGKPLRSSINGFVMMDVGEAYIQLMDALHSSVNADDMMMRLNKLSQKYPNYRLLYKRLLKESYTPVDAVDENGDVVEVTRPTYKNLTTSGFELLGSFWRTFKKQQPDIITVFHLEGGITQVTDTSLTSAARNAQYGLRNNLINAIKDNKGAGLFYYGNGNYTADVSENGAFSKVKFDPNQPVTYTNFLKKLGINFPVAKIEGLTNNQYKDFIENVQGLKLSLEKIDKVPSLTKQTLGAEGHLFNLGITKAIIENEEFQSTYFNVNGERAQTYIGPNALSNFYDNINAVNERKELANTEYDYLVEDVDGRVNDPMSEGSVMMERLFAKNGKKNDRAKGLMKPVFVDGTVDVENDKNTDSSKLKFTQRIIQEINSNLEGIFMNLIPGDASIEWALKMFHKENPFVSLTEYKEENYVKIFRNYLISEIKLVKQNRPTPNPKNSKKLRFFDDILPAGLQRDILKSKETPENTVKKFGRQIDDAVTKYVKEEAAETTALLKEYRLIVSDKEGVRTPRINFTEKGPISEKELNAKIGQLTANYMIANIEMHKLIYSDPYQYSDELKRIKSFSSPRQALLHGSTALNVTLGRLYNRGYVYNRKTGKKDIGWSDMQREYFRSLTMKDLFSVDEYLGKLSPELKSYLDPYEKTDGGGYITIKARRKADLRAGTWSPEKEAQYRYDIAYEKHHRGIELSEAEKEIFDPEKGGKDNPGVQGMYTPIKPVITGRKSNGRSYNDVMLDKFALFPLSYRVLHQMGADTNMIDVYLKMQNEDLDYAVYGTGRKVGAELQYEMYKDGKINTEPTQTTAQVKNKKSPQYVINVPFSSWSIQTDVPTKEESGTTQGSQITKLITLDMLDAGVPIDYVLENDKGKIITDPSERYNAWLLLDTEAKREAASPLYKEIKNNQSILEARIKLGYEKVLLKLGIKETVDTFDQSKYQVVKRDRLINTLRDEIFSRDVNENISDSFKDFLSEESVLEATTSYQQIRNILFSIARKNITRPKISGGYKVQMMSAFFEQNDIEVKTVNGKEVVMSESLRNYVNEDGKRTCEIMVARWFDSPLSDEELLNYLNNTEEGKKLLEGIGYRIPTQKQNSVEVFVVAKFLPKEMKDTVVVPSALVRKTGADFDIDKLSVYLKNAIGGRKPKAIEFLTDENSTLEERYFNWVKEMSDSDTKNYLNFLARDEINAITKKYKAQKVGNYETYLKKKEFVKETAGEYYDETMDTKKEGITDQDIRMRELFDEGKKFFVQLSEQTLAHYFDLKTQIAIEGVKGPAEITRYLMLTEMLMKQKGISNQDKLLMSAMVINYKEELETIGAHENFIVRIYERMAEIKEDKTANIETILNEIKTLNEEVSAELDTEKQKINMAWAQEAASIEDLMNIEEFSKLSKYEQNAAKNLDNAYIESLFNLGTHELNFHRLVIPNSADEAKAILKDINDKLGKKPIDYSKPGNMLKRKFMSSLRHAFVSGKYAIGIAAIGQTNNSNNQRSLITLNEERIKTLEWRDKKYLTDVKFNFVDEKGRPNYNTINGDVTLSLSKNAEGKYISDIIGQFIDGYVDISKGPWIMELGATSNVAGTWLFLLKSGVPFKQVAYFMNQPIIRDYIQALDRSGFSTLFSKNVIADVMEEYAGKSEKKFTSLPTTSQLLKNIGKTEGFSEDQNAEQRYILNEFLKYAKMSEQLMTYVQGSNFDTANFNDPFLIFKKLEQLEKAKKSVVSDVQSNLNDSSIGVLVETLKKVRDAFAEILVSDRKGEGGVKGPREILETILLPYVSPYVNDKDFVTFARKAVENLFDWTMQTGSGLNSFIDKSFYGNDTRKSTVKEMMDLKRAIQKDVRHPLYNNVVIKNLEILPSSRANRIDNIYIKNKDNRVFNQNLTINAFREIKAYLGAERYNNFIKLGILQSGLTNSHISFTHLIPYEDFRAHYNTFLSMIGTNPNLENFLELHEFQRTNPSNSQIVPKFEDRSVTLINYNNPEGADKKVRSATLNIQKNLQKHIDAGLVSPVIKVEVWDQAAAHDVISYGWIDQTIGWRKRNAMKERGDTSFFKKAIYQKVYEYDELGNRVPLIQPDKAKDGRVFEKYIYKMINTRGDSYRAQEHYDKIIDPVSQEALGVKSAIETDYESVTETSDQQIVDIFYGENIIPKETPLEVITKKGGKVIQKQTSLFNLEPAKKLKGKPEFNKLPSVSKTPTMTYAGIGSRSTPAPVLAKMKIWAKKLETLGYKLNTGDAQGADAAFATSVKNKRVYTTKDANVVTRKIAKEIHPNPKALKAYVLDLMARNTNQVFGTKLDTPVDFVLFYAEEGEGRRPLGGTGQAVEMARLKGIPTINMATKGWEKRANAILRKSDKRSNAQAFTEELSLDAKQTSKGNKFYELEALETKLYIDTKRVAIQGKSYAADWLTPDKIMEKHPSYTKEQAGEIMKEIYKKILC